MNKLTGMCLALMALTFAPRAGAQGEIVDGSSSFEWANFGDGSGEFVEWQAGLSNFFVNGAEHLGQYWFYFRHEQGVNPGDADPPAWDREYPFGRPTQEQYLQQPAAFDLRWQGVATMGFDARLRGRLVEPQPGRARLSQRLIITNTRDTQLNLAIFAYADLDVVDIFGGHQDTAAMIGRNRIRIDDQGFFDFAEFAAPGAAHFNVQPWPNLRDFHLIDSGPDDLNRTGLPFGPAAFTGAYGWQLSLAPGESASLPLALSVNMPAVGGAALLSDSSAASASNLSAQRLRIASRIVDDPGNIGGSGNLSAPAPGGANLLGVAWSGLSHVISPANGTGGVLGSTHWDRVNALASDATGVVFAIARFSLISINPITGEGTHRAQLPIDNVRAASFSSTTPGMLYAVSRDANQVDSLVTIDVSQGTVQSVATISDSGIEALAWDSEGRLFAWHARPDGAGMGLVVLNPVNGQVDDLLPLVGENANVRALTFGTDGVLYGARHRLHTINKTTGAVIMLPGRGYFDLGGLASPPPPI